MQPANADYGNRLFTKLGPPPRGLAWMLAGVLLIGAALFIQFGSASARPWGEWLLTARFNYVHGAVAGVGVFGVCLGAVRRRQTRSARHFFETAACYERGGHRQWLTYADVETVTFATRAAEGRVQRVLEFSGPGGKPQMRLFTDLGDGEAGDERVASVAEVTNASTRVVRAVAAGMLERVDRGEVVRWADRLWLDPAGVRLDEPQGKLVPWGAIDGVKDGSTDARMQVYAFGLPQPVAACLTHEPNALPGFQAFRCLLDRAQASRAA